MLEGCFPEQRRFPEEKPAAWTEPAPAPELISRRKKISILWNLGTASVIVNFPEPPQWAGIFCAPRNSRADGPLTVRK